MFVLFGLQVPRWVSCIADCTRTAHAMATSSSPCRGVWALPLSPIRHSARAGTARRVDFRRDRGGRFCEMGRGDPPPTTLLVPGSRLWGLPLDPCSPLGCGLGTDQGPAG